MPIRQDDNQPNRRFGVVNIILIGVGALLLFSSLFPNQNMQIPRVPYSLFIDQVNDGEVKRGSSFLNVLPPITIASKQAL